jgi:molybdenum cofactor guanylyltransferase
MPCIETAVVSYLFEMIGDTDAAIPSWNAEMLEPLHAVYRRSALLGYLGSHESLSLRPMIRSLNTRYVPVDELRRFDPALRTFTNVNKLEELDRINAMAAEKPGSDESGRSQEGPDGTSH